MWAINNARQNGLDISFKLVYTGRSDDPTLEQTLFADLQISQPDVYLGVDCDSLNELTGRVMAEFERYLAANKTDVVIVVDDLASTMAVAIVTKKCGVRLAHLVAGTRSFDINMPKEINRLVIDGLSDYRAREPPCRRFTWWETYSWTRSASTIHACAGQLS